MTPDETKKIMKVIETSYPITKTFTDEETKLQFSIWCDAFKDVPYAICARVVTDIIQNEDREFAPSLGHIKSRINKLLDTTLDPEDAWHLVKKAIQTWDVVESWRQLPKDIQRVVTPTDLQDWGKMDSDDVNNWVKTSFMKSYKRSTDNQKELARLPQQIKDLLGITQREEELDKIRMGGLVDYDKQQLMIAQSIKKDIKRIEDEKSEVGEM